MPDLNLVFFHCLATSLIILAHCLFMFNVSSSMFYKSWYDLSLSKVSGFPPSLFSNRFFRASAWKWSRSFVVRFHTSIPRQCVYIRRYHSGQVTDYWEQTLVNTLIEMILPERGKKSTKYLGKHHCCFCWSTQIAGMMIYDKCLAKGTKEIEGITGLLCVQECSYASQVFMSFKLLGSKHVCWL